MIGIQILNHLYDATTLVTAVKDYYQAERCFSLSRAHVVRVSWRAARHTILRLKLNHRDSGGETSKVLKEIREIWRKKKCQS
ncbi:hypothetical protein VNO78_28802 [Psophocarpus tetragonolobus]|uniref:Uncharacterized protein n=1 Tax=Psophocarpus tetragonolobus TaxID=3891 RepID=A0AAN9X1E9_PSOTE